MRGERREEGEGREEPSQTWEWLLPSPQPVLGYSRKPWFSDHLNLKVPFSFCLSPSPTAMSGCPCHHCPTTDKITITVTRLSLSQPNTVISVQPRDPLPGPTLQQTSPDVRHLQLWDASLTPVLLPGMEAKPGAWGQMLNH